MEGGEKGKGDMSERVTTDGVWVMVLMLVMVLIVIVIVVGVEGGGR